MRPVTKSPSYLIRNPYSYCFRMVVPKDLQSLVGRKEMRYSLKTGYLGVAKYKARLLAGQVQRIFKYLRKGYFALGTLSNEKIKQLVGKHISDFLEDLEGSYYDSDKPQFKTSRDYDEHIVNLDYYKEITAKRLGMGDYSPVEGKVADLLEENGIDPVEKDSVPYIKLCREMYKADMGMLEVEKRHLKGDYSYQNEMSDIFPTVYPKTDASPQNLINQTSETLSAVVEAYWNEKVGDWKNRSQTQYKGVQTWLLDTLGRDTQIHTVDYQTGKDVKEKLRAKKNQAGKPLSKDRVNVYLNHMSAIWNWAKRNYRDQVTLNPFEGLQLTEKKKRADELRDAFTIDDLKKLFVDSKYFGQDKWGKCNYPHFFCIPLIALYTGCRLEEICQLYVDNVRQFDGIWCLDINEDKPDQSVKKGERRIVPLHPFIWKDLNFVGYVKGLKDQKGRVFPELTRVNDRYGHSFGQWFGRFKKRNGIIGNKTFHSFRHTIITTLLEKDVPDNQIAQLVGHISSGQTTGRYGKRFKPKMLFEKTIEKLNYDIDLSHLKSSKWVPR